MVVSGDVVVAVRLRVVVMLYSSFWWCCGGGNGGCVLERKCTIAAYTQGEA